MPRISDYERQNRRREYDRAVLGALRGEGPLSRRDLEFECHLSRKDVQRTLERLQERDLVETCDNPDDGRVPLYRIRADLTEPVVDLGARAQGRPDGVVVLVVVVIALLVFAVAMGVMA